MLYSQYINLKIIILNTFNSWDGVKDISLKLFSSNEISNSSTCCFSDKIQSWLVLDWSNKCNKYLII